MKFKLFVIFCSIVLTSADLNSEFESSLNQFVLDTVHSDLNDLHIEVLRLNFPDDPIVTSKYSEEPIYQKLEKLHDRTDTIDFELMAFSWMLNMYWDSPLLSQTLKDDIVEELINIPYWLSDSGELGPMQFWSENHIIGWRAAQYLIGHGFTLHDELKDMTFTERNETKGADLREFGKKGVEDWLEYRSRFGFSEFNSDTYGPIAYEDMLPLSVLSPDEDIRIKANSIQSLLEFDHIIGSRRDRIATPRGRAYTEGKTRDKHYYGLNLFKGLQPVKLGEKTTIYLAHNIMHGYQFPTALLEIGRQIENGTHVLKERFGLRSEDGPSEWIFNNTEQCIFWLGDGAYFSPTYPECMFVIGDNYNLWERSEIWEALSPFKLLWDTDKYIVTFVGETFYPLGAGPVLGYANVYTYRTRDFFLSSAQNYNKGWTAGQQHAWQLTIDTDNNGTILTQQPLLPNPSDGHDDSYWVGGVLPKVVQSGTTLISIYNPAPLVNILFPLNMTHANVFTPSYEVDNAITANNGGWLFARDGDSYVGLYSHNPAEFRDDGYAPRDLVAPGVKNVWICEAGSSNLNGTFENFKQTLEQSTVNVEFTQANPNRNDTLLYCLIDNDCFTGIDTLLRCLTITCRDFMYDANSELGQCLSQAEFPELPKEDFVIRSLDQHMLENVVPLLYKNANFFACFMALENGATVEYTRGDNRSINVDWDGDFVIDGHVVDLSNYKRYDNEFSTVEWGSKQFNIESTNYQINIDFDAGTFGHQPKPNSANRHLISLLSLFALAIIIAKII